MTASVRTRPSPGLLIGLAAFFLQLLTSSRYGYFRDELYYLACAQHLAWGYVDQPPLIAFAAWLARHVGGDSLLSIRFLPAAAGGATVWLSAYLAEKLGASRFGQLAASLAVLLSPGFLALFHLLTMNAFEPPLWTAIAVLLVRIVDSGEERLWLAIGALAGVGMLNKWSMAFFGAALALGVVLSPARRSLLRPWIWLGALLALLIWLPNVLWNIDHHWPFLELMANVRASGRDVVRSPIPFFLDQALNMGPVSAPLWIAGGIWLLLRRRYAALGWAWAALLVFFIGSGGKSYYLFPIYPILFGAGGVALENASAGPWRMLRPVYLAAMVACGVLLAPFTLPVLSPEGLIRYQAALHFTPPPIEHQRTGPLHQQLYADMFGWEEAVAEVARVYSTLPPDIRARTVVAAGNYGDAGAVDFFGPRYGIPPAISGHQSYWLWGPRDVTGESLLFLNQSEERVRELCENVDRVGHVEHPYSREDEHYDIYWCHPLKGTLQELWPRAKHFN